MRAPRQRRSAVHRIWATTMPRRLTESGRLAECRESHRPQDVLSGVGAGEPERCRAGRARPRQAETSAIRWSPSCPPAALPRMVSEAIGIGISSWCRWPWSTGCPSATESLAASAYCFAAADLTADFKRDWSATLTSGRSSTSHRGCADLVSSLSSRKSQVGA